MKKLILTTILLLTSILGFSQHNTYVTDTTKKESPLIASVSTTLRYTLNVPRLQTYYQPSPYVGINLNLSKAPSHYSDGNDRKTAFACIFVGGLAFTTAALLESGDFKIYQGETARQIMFGVGIGLTLTGGIGMISSK